MEAPKPFKKRKLTDKTLPPGLGSEIEESALYQELLDMERKLDWTMTRKLAEVTDALGKTPTVTRTLRIFLSHTASGQQWQEGAGGGKESVDLQSGQGIPAWTFKVEGRLLDSTVSRQNKAPPRKFSSFLKRMIVEFDQDPNLYAERNIVEWHRSPSQPDQDGFEIKRRGDRDVQARVLIHLQHMPEKYALAPELARLLDVKADTRTNVVTALWNYIKINALQDKVDRKLVRTDAELRALFGGAEQVAFTDIPAFVNRLLAPLDPIQLAYTITVGTPGPAIKAFDVEVEIEDTALKNKLNNVAVNMTSESAKQLAALDDEIAQVAQAVRNAKQKRDFLNSFANDPANFINTWLASQSRDLEVILGNEHGVKDEDLKRSDFFRLPWVEEAVAVQEGLRVAGALARPDR